MLEGDHEADVCVRGRLPGLSTAMNLAERGYRVAVVEANSVGWGASGRNGGQIGTDFSSDIEKIDWVGAEDARGCGTWSRRARPSSASGSRAMPSTAT